MVLAQPSFTKGCIDNYKSTSYFLSPGINVSIDTLVTHVTCYGGSDGNIFITPSGLLNPSFLWSDGFTLEDRLNLSAGTYSVQISNNNIGLFSYTFTIKEPDTLFIISQQSSYVCKGDASGEIQTFIYGGTQPYSIVWNNGINTQINSNLEAGDYMLSVNDANNCILQDTFTINQYTFKMDAIASDVSCYSYSNGAIDIEVINGFPPYMYLWNTGDITEDINTLSPGLYTCTISDTLGCVRDSTFLVNEPQLLIATSDISNVSCYGGNDGSVSLNIIGGTNPYNVDWGSIDTNNLFAGIYNFEITDSNGCIFNDLIEITQEDSLEVSISKIDVHCFGESTGSIQIIIAGGSGTPPYNYLWNGPNQWSSNVEDIYNLYAGVYTLLITDANDCSKNLQIIINESTPLNQFVNIQSSNYSGYHISCKGNQSGWLSVSANGGYIPYNFLWSNGETTDSIYNLFSGSYSLTVTDGIGCDYNYQINLFEPSDYITGIIQSTSNYNGFDIRCFNGSDGSILETASGGIPPYTYFWNNGGIKDSVIHLESGYHEVFVYDKNNCLWIDSITLIQPDSFFFNLNIYPDTCNKNLGFSSVDVFGGVSPYMYNWSNGSNLSVYNNFSEGRYHIIVEDLNQCIISDSVIINNLEKPITDFLIFTSPSRWHEQQDNPIAFVDITEGGWQSIIDWSWDFGDNNYESDSLSYHSYSEIGTFRVLLTIHSEYDCIDTISKLVTINDFDLFIPNAFTPTLEDNLNNYFQPKGYGISNYELKILTRWGEIVFTSDNINLGWDGSYMNLGKECQSGVYTYSIIIEDIFGALHTYKGQINLIR